MSEQSKNTKRNNRQSLLDTLYKYCFVIAFSVSLLGQYVLDLSQAGARYVDATHAKSSISDGSGLVSHHSLDFPFDAEPENSEEIDEDFPADQHHDVQLWNAMLAHIFRNSVAKSSFANFSSHIANRKTVSLVILHHSWKSFLS
jgi:hypothetical protein